MKKILKSIKHIGSSKIGLINIKKPKSKGKCRVPVVMQLEELECGAACLAMVLAYYNKWIPLEQIRKDCGVSRDGSRASNVIQAAKTYGLDGDGYSYDVNDLKNVCHYPAIIFWNKNHFVVLNGFRGKKAYINDPARGTYSLPINQFEQSYSGVCLTFEPNEKFEPSGKQKSIWEFTKKRLMRAKTAFVFVALVSIISALFGIFSPVFQRIFLDRLLPGQDPSWVSPFLIAFGVFCLIQFIFAVVQEFYSLRLSGKIAATATSNFMWKILRLPVEYFSQRMAGDIQERKNANTSIVSVIINTIAPLAVQFIMMIVYFVVMIRYNWILTLVGLTAILFNFLVSQYISRRRINISRVIVRDQAKASAASIAGIEMIETIKAAGAENGYFARLAGYRANVNNQQIKFSKTENYLGVIASFISQLANSLVLVLGVFFVIKGEFTVGMIMAFQGFLSSFLSPTTQLIQASQTIQEMRTQLERVNDVTEYPDDDNFADLKLNNDIEYDKLSGNIILKNVTFGYSPLDKPLIKDFNLTLTPGKSVAIVGATGSGKSTIAKLIAGLYAPWSGEILFDGKSTKEIDKSIFASSVAVVDQDITLFEDTIENNIKMWDTTIQNYEVVLAARDAQIHDAIMERTGGYKFKVNENGKNFSGGERQRLEIARVLAQDPTIVIFDEATSALDAKTEYELVKAVEKRGVTSIIVAHRLSTIRSCDEIILLSEGVPIARGKHNELMASCQEYRDLIMTE